MKTNPRFSARLPLLLLSLSCVAGSLSSCKDAKIEASRQRRDSHAEAAEVKKQHRAELKELNARIASLEAGKEEAGDPFAIEPPPLPPEELAPEPPTAVAAEPDEPDEPDEEEDSLDARDRRKIGTYQQKGLAGVPPEISAEIVRRARRDTRNWAALDEIDAQSEGYRTVQAFAVTDTKMLREERDELVFAVKRQFPNDWASMAREIHAQTDAWKVLEEWKVTGVPGLRPWESIAVLEAAANRYPFDWKAAIADVAEQSQKEVQARRSASAGK